MWLSVDLTGLPFFFPLLFTCSLDLHYLAIMDQTSSNERSPATKYEEEYIDDGLEECDDDDYDDFLQDELNDADAWDTVTGGWLRFYCARKPNQTFTHPLFSILFRFHKTIQPPPSSNSTKCRLQRSSSSPCCKHCGQEGNRGQ